MLMIEKKLQWKYDRKYTFLKINWNYVIGQNFLIVGRKIGLII